MDLDISIYNSTEITFHRIAQFIALTGINLIKKEADDSHSNMAWEASTGVLAGRYFTIRGQKFRLVFKPDSFHLVFEDDQRIIKSKLKLAERSVDEIMAWWEENIFMLGYQGKLVKTPHYQLPDQPEYHASNLKAPDQHSLSLWINWRTQANGVLKELNKLAGINADIRIWPHHFDTGVYYPFKYDDGSEIQSVGAGLAIADTMIPEPYYYIYGWSKTGDIDYTRTPALEKGKWLTDGWKGAVLTAREAESRKEPGGKRPMW